MSRRGVALAALASGVVFAGCSGDKPFAALVGRPAYLQIRVQPNGARIGSSLAVQPIVEVHDGRGGQLLTDTVSVTVILSSGDGELLGTLTERTVNGVARFTDLRLRGTYGTKTLAFTSAGLSSATANSITLLPPLRSLQDRPDDIAGPQVHVVYVLPRGGTDRQLDTKVDIANSAAAFQAWLVRAAGLQIRFDQYEGALDVSFFALSRSDAEMQTFGASIISEIERQLALAGIIQQTKRYLIYYDGGSQYSCGGAAWPPTVPGQAAAVYLRACAAGDLASQPGSAPGYWEFAALHDLFHTLGVVSAAAPHHTVDRPAHVPEPQDLMYAGADPWWPSFVDVGNDDYFAPNLPDGVANLASNAFLVGVGLPASSAATAPGARATITSNLPPHPPFP